jgi:molybdenum cofactor cytidylyltransferase
MLLADEPSAGGPAPQRAAIVLAAGASTRLGQPKQLVLFKGKSLLRRTAEAAIASGAWPVVVVLGRDAEALSPELAGLAVAAVANSQWQEGMGSSLRCGVEALQRRSRATTAVLLMVCDQPRISAAHLEGMWTRYAATGKVVAARHGDRPGVPAIFPAKYLPDLAQSAGDEGARNLLGGLVTEEIELVALPEAGFDLDTPDDLARLVEGS